ncbi:MAG: hypothetical protein WDO16_08475 [Bacteroidota bacterium]
MPENAGREKQLQWVCRILMTINVLLLCSGYISFFQLKYQLDSPLIPKSTIYRIFADTDKMIMNASIFSGIIFIAGFWFYSFNKKVIAAVLFATCIICFMLLLL